MLLPKMSIIFERDKCFLISHDQYIRNVYNCTYNNEELQSYILNPGIFNIKTPYKKPTAKKFETFDSERDLVYINQKYNDFKKAIDTNKSINKEKQMETNNSIALDTAKTIYNNCAKNFQNSSGENNSKYSTLQIVNNNSYLFPSNCKFYNYDVIDLHRHLGNELYDVILLDPPWWNKYIRRKRKKSNDSYDMMYNTDLLKLPVADILKDDGIVVLWCTNSQQNFTALERMLEAWKLKVVSRWFWLKVTASGEPICSFAKPPGKQPFERVFIGCSAKHSKLAELESSNDSLIVSIPSSLHSHKPPLVELLKPFLPENPKCLEIFARYLLPGWTSYGLEAIKFQHICAYIKL